MTKKRRLQFNLLLTVFFLVMIIINGPNLNPLYSDGAFAWCFMLSCYVGLNFLLALGGLRLEADAYNRMHLSMDSSIKGVKKGMILLGIIWALYVLVMILSTPIFNYPAYRDQLGHADTSEFTQTVQPLSLSQLPIVDQALARELADKKVGENPGLGSQVVLGDPVIQTVQDKLVWVVPLQHSGFFKWLKNMDGSAGYIVVSATDLSDVELVSSHKLKYQPNAYILDDLNRHVRLFNGGLFRGLTDYSFELDDEGNPYWVLTSYKNNWLFSLPEADGILLVNATTGEGIHYDLQHIPEWVDRVQPEDFIMQQIQNQGEYVHGFLNFSNQDKFRPSQGHIIVYNNSDCYLFTGLTSVGSDESAIGFMMINMVTKEVKKYQMSGATEMAAMQSAQGKVQQFGYRASFPMIINLDGRPTYFMTLKDNAGLIKQYAFVSVSNYTSVGTGETINSALRNFRQVINNTGDGIVTGEDAETVTGTILRIASEPLGDGLTYKMILEEEKDRIFICAYDLSNELALTEPGDKVKLECLPSGDGICTVMTFDNLEFEQK
ncbi:hypothetical protein GPL15_07515 [Clostridium sp. MCC353]|uniref:hypothetical protein n=1 Tax=Clostridium sp. MCC353 TaxID=2592646 RepID=UPI001C02CE90|nr:hypothetical protein [Clostridium sp. MCC353]MBT9776348.1 hypothetical protein [Clostridium sp. MCC353]